MSKTVLTQGPEGKGAASLLLEFFHKNMYFLNRLDPEAVSKTPHPPNTHGETPNKIHFSTRYYAECVFGLEHCLFFIN